MPANFVNTLISSGLDAFTNLYDMEIYLPKDVLTSLSAKSLVTGETDTSMTNLLKLRVGDFTAPQPKIEQYITDYKTVQISRMAPMLVFDRKFNVTFRIDSNYKAYYALKQWSLLYHDVNQGGINLPFGFGDETGILGSIIVRAYTPSNDNTEAMVWTYDKVICNTVTEPTYARSGTEPATVTAIFMFFEYLLPDASEPKKLSGSLTTTS